MISDERLEELVAMQVSPFCETKSASLGEWQDIARELLSERKQHPGTTRAALDGWVKYSDRLPAPGVVVEVFSPEVEGVAPWSIDFDYIDPEAEASDLWFCHSEVAEHYHSVAKEGTGPAEKAPYTHWRPLTPPTDIT